MADNSEAVGVDELASGLGETETLPGGGVTVGDSVPEMPPGSGQEDPGGGLTADDVAQPTPSGDPTGDGATGLTGLRGS